MLERLGLTVITAGDGREAVEIYRAGPAAIDLVVLDLTMPRLDGVQAFAELRQVNPDVKVILASGYSQDDIASRFSGCRPAGLLQKPYSLERIKALLMLLLPEA